ncbi:kinase-like domain-containing protein [Amylostereum chailletii]|nr:kinase-like domain-containing protein [Amylostereum chailletii]
MVQGLSASNKRSASKSPDGDRPPPPKRPMTSSPEEGELDDRPISVSDPHGPPTGRPAEKPKPRVAFPFKTKKFDEAGSASGSALSTGDSRATLNRDRPREGERWAGERERAPYGRPPHRSSPAGRKGSHIDKVSDNRGWGRDGGQYDDNDDRKPNGYGESGRRHDRPRSPSPTRSRTSYSTRRGRGRTPSRSPSPSSRASTSSHSPGSRRGKHRLPPSHSAHLSPSPPRRRRGSKNYGYDAEYNDDRHYYKGDTDLVNNWNPRHESRDARHWRPDSPPRPPYNDRDNSRRDVSNRGYSRREENPSREEGHYDQRRDWYDRETSYRRQDGHRPISPIPYALPPRPRSFSPGQLRSTPKSPPPQPLSPPPPPPDQSQNEDGESATNPIVTHLPSRRPPPAPKDTHSPTPISLPSVTVAREREPGECPDPPDTTHSLSSSLAPSPSPLKHITIPKPKRVGMPRSRQDEAKVYGRYFVGCSQQEDYDAMTKLGEGTFGEVHKAKHRHTGKLVALKRILMHNEKEGMPVTALREIKILKALRHPNIVELLDMFVVHSKKDQPLSVYMVFPYMDHDFAGLLENERVKLMPSQIKLYMKQLLEGTEYMHRNHILHRDMKAANLLISNDGTLKIADFGLARSYHLTSLNPHEIQSEIFKKDRKYTNCVVTRWYRPPELLLGSRNYGGEIDIWGIGCVLGEMFHRHPILPGTSDLDQLEKIWQMCGTPNQQSWPNFDTLPGCEGVRRFTYYAKRLSAVFETLGEETLDLLDKLLTCNPSERITATEALSHDYFWTDPLAADPKTLPQYEASHEFDKRGRRQHPPVHPMLPPQPMQVPPASNPPPLYFGRSGPPRDNYRQGQPSNNIPPPTLSSMPARGGFHGRNGYAGPPGPAYGNEPGPWNNGPPGPQHYGVGGLPPPHWAARPPMLYHSQPYMPAPVDTRNRPAHLPARPPVPMSFDGRSGHGHGRHGGHGDRGHPPPQVAQDAGGGLPYG